MIPRPSRLARKLQQIAMSGASLHQPNPDMTPKTGSNPPSISFNLFTGLVVVLAWMAPFQLFATHNLAGDITYRYLGNNSVEITVTTYTDPSAFNVDRCEIDIEIWNAAGTTKLTDITGIPRQNGPFFNDPLYPISCPTQQMGEYIFGSVKKNIYKTTYTFPGPGWYLIRFHDLARLDNILNMFNSGNQEFFIETTVLINNYLGAENSPQFLNHPVDQACTGKLWTHNPGGYDPDGDSLVYSFVPCRQYDGTNITTPVTCTGFVQPDQYQNNGPMIMDPTTGFITWNVPQVQGIYNIAYVIEEYREGVLIGRSFRDMGIFVNPCNNNPPEIDAITDTCVFAGTALQVDFEIWDPDFDRLPPPGDSIYFYLNNNGINNNGPFAVTNNPALLTITQPLGQAIPPTYPVDHNDTIRGEIEWNTLCEHIRPQFYQVDFYVHDNLAYYGTQMLSKHHVMKIRVLPAPVTGLVVIAANQQVTLNWDPHSCNTALGYEIFRKSGSGGYLQDSVCCQSEPSGSGYQLIGTTSGHTSTQFVDDNGGEPFPYGGEICYLVRAIFPENMRTCASNEVCIEIQKDFAVLLKDSVNVTSTMAGSISVAWSQPTAIDTVFFPRPYTYDLYRSEGLSGATNWQLVATSIPFQDTTYFDTGLNTTDFAYRYRVETIDANGHLISNGNYGSSIRLGITPGDKQLTLAWQEVVPWTNRLYDIYRADGPSNPLTYIATVPGSGASTHTYIDRGLTNFEDYCYVVVSEGEYGRAEVPDSVRNASQRACGVPVDLEPPCIGTIEFDTSRNCVNHTITFNWTEPDSACGADVDFYQIWRADNRTSDFNVIAQVDSGVNFYNVPGLSSIADCYGITAVDTNGNESQMVTYCFENCPEVSIGNVFSPNGDGVNDYFAPLLDRNVRISVVQIFDRWGGLVYQATNLPDPQRIWDGRTTKGNPAPEGVYFYVIWYEEDRLPGYVLRQPLSGNVSLFR